MSLELKKKQVELKKVDAAKEGMELKILEYQEEIDRLYGSIDKQNEHIEKLKQEIAEIEGD